jgi:hypothetical protein
MRAFPRALRVAVAKSVPPPAPVHTGPPLRVGEICLLRRPGEFFDVIVQLRGIDGDQAAIRILDKFEVVELRWLRRYEVPR